jgi:outer membrane receptor for ferrienterochelin and colicins
MLNKFRRIKGFAAAGLVLLGLTLLTGGVKAAETTADTAENLGEILVTTSTKTERKESEVPVKVEVITQAELEAANVQTAQEALNLLPGVNVNGDGCLRVRGMEGRQTLILIDGQRYYGGHDGVDLSNIPVEMIEQIEVVKGPASALYGSDALGGVINIITKKKANGGVLAINGGSRGSKNYDVNTGFGGGKFTGLANFAYREADRDANETAGYDEKMFNFSLGYNFNPQSKLEVSPYYSKRYQEYDARTYEREGLNLNWKYAPDELSRLYVRGSLLTYKQWTDSRATDQITDSNEVELGYSRLLGTQHLVTAGAQNHMENINDRGKKYEKDQQINSFFVQDEIDLTPLQIVLGTRVDHHELWGSELNPNLSIAYQINERGRIRGSVGRAFAAPTLSKLYASDYKMGAYRVHANPDLKPEKSLGYQLGLDYELSQRVGLETTLFRNDIDDLLSNTKTIISGVKHMNWVNIGEATTEGVEVNLRVRCSDRLKSVWGYTYLKTRDKTTGKELVERPHNVISLSLDWQGPYEIQTRLTGKYFGKRYSNTANTIELDDYTTVELSVEKKLSAKYSIYAKIKNLLDEEGIDDAYELDGVGYYAGVKLRF